MELATRYFSTRGPASIQDFAWWSGLGITQIKKAIAELGDKLQKLENPNSKDKLHPNAALFQIASQSGISSPLPANEKQRAEKGRLHFLAAFDEYLISYKDRTSMLPANFNRQIITVNGMFRPAVAEMGKIIAGWQVENRRNKDGKTGLKIKILPFTALNASAQKQLLKKAEPEALAYARFRQLPLEALQLG